MAIDAPQRSIFFYPQRPGSVLMLEQMRCLAGWELADSPDAADWCVLNDPPTWVVLPEGDPWSEASLTWINGRCRDISKRTVERVFDEVFGYPLAVDPLTHQGLCLRKSNKNYTKDATAIECPIAAVDVDKRFTYQRLIDSRIPKLGVVELRVTMVGGAIATVRRKIIPDWFTNGGSTEAKMDEAIVYPDSIFSPHEQERLSAFCDAIGLDFGGLDIMRDKDDGRIYVLDANKTPGFGLKGAIAAFKLEQVVRAFIERFPPRSTKPKSTKPAKKRDRTAAAHGMSDRQFSEDGIATFVEEQTKRCTRLEADVGELRADIARVLSALGIERQRSRKKKRKS